MEADVKEQLDDILAQHKGERSDLIPILQQAQEKFGYLPKDVMLGIAKFLHLAESTVFGVSTFYAQFKFVPIGRNVINVCRGTACHVRGADRILDEFRRQLGIEQGETTEDLEYSLETIACFGSCALAPVVVINKVVYGRMTTTKARELLAKDKDKDKK